VNPRKILFIDRDGTLIVEPPDFQIDRFEKLDLVEGVIPALLQLISAGYELVMVTNQDGLGTESFPQKEFDGPHALLLRILKSQGIAFREIVIDRSFAHQNLDTRKPGTALMRHYLAADDWSRAESAVIGDRETDLQFAANLGVRGFRLGSEWNWRSIAHTLCASPRTASVERKTRETTIRVTVDLDRSADAVVSTGLGFFDHMLEQIGKHSGISLTLKCDGDSDVDEHHIVEDCALALGECLRKALGDKRGIGRYGSDVEGVDARSIEIVLPIARERVGDLPTELVPHFFRSLCESLGANLHLSVRGENAHHMVEACFKSVARALRQALRREGDAMPSTKGVL
jgi:imidazoleglycerol-phosphate dehydratase / histidinol-phosphatase